MKVLWTKESLQRLIDIEEYISRDNPDIAEKFINEIIFQAETLSKHPQKGRVVPEFSLSQIRELLHKNYRIVYLLKKNKIEILTVFEGHRLIKKEEILKE